MDSIDSICEQFSSFEMNDINEYNELVYYLNFQSNCIENIILALLNSDKRYKRYLRNIFIWNINGNDNNDIPEDIEKYLRLVLPEDNQRGIIYEKELVKTKLELMRKIDSKIFNVLRSMN